MRNLARRSVRTWRGRTLSSRSYGCCRSHSTATNRNDGDSPIVDGAVFGYVWVQLAPTRKFFSSSKPVARGMKSGGISLPARFTNREAWVKYQKREIWRVASTRAGSVGMTSQPYGLFVVKTIPNQVER